MHSVSFSNQSSKFLEGGQTKVSKTKITQQMRYRESLIKYADKHGVSKAARLPADN